MGKRADARTAKALEAVLAKAGLTGTPQSNSGASLVPASDIAGTPTGHMPSLARSLARDPGTFGAMMGPNYPLIPWPIDELGPGGRPDPRKFQFDISWNLQVSKQLAKWSTLTAAATQVDIMARCISIRQADVTKMDWSFTVSSDAVNTIMEDNNIGISEADRIARKQFMPEIVRSSEFMENPFPQSDRD